MDTIRIVIERHHNGYVAYPVDMMGVVAGEGDTFDEASADVRSAIRFRIETFGPDVIENGGVGNLK